MYTGLTGKVTIDGAKVAYISNWSVENSVEITEFAEMGRGTRHKKAGLTNWTANADGAIYFGDDGRSGHKALFDAMNQGKEIDCQFYLYDDEKEHSNRQYSVMPESGTSIVNRYKPAVMFSGKALIESLSVDLSAEDTGSISISVTGCGALGYPGSAEAE